MGCYRISQRAKELRQKYFEKYGEMPRGMLYRDGETMKKYEKYLEKELSK